MPFIIRADPCKVCGERDKETRLKWSSKNNKYYLLSKCIECEKQSYKKYQEENREYFREINRKQYLKKVGKHKRRSPLIMTEELRAEWYRDKATIRCTRAKQARVSWDKELTDFVYKEAHELRKARNNLTNISWHVDHIVPLKGENVCGLHTWNNFAVIPSVENLRKGNNHTVHD